MEYQASDDRLSDLPLSIIHLILHRVPITDAIRTCVLSKEWRYTWTTLPCLLFNCTPVDLDDGKSTTNFITNALLHHKGPIHSFEISYIHKCSIQTVKEWVLCLSRNDIRELGIRISLDWDDDPNSLESSIFSCTKLTNLVLWKIKMDPPPSTFKGFLFLTSVVLVKVELSPDGVQSLIGNCPHLERLSTVYCPNSELRIRSPNLKLLQVAGQYTELCLYAPLLRRLYVALTVSQFRRENQSLVCNYTNFFGGFINLVELTGLDYFMQYLSIGIESCHSTLVFHHLNFIKLYGVDFEDIKQISVVTRLIIGAPNLHNLQIKAILRNEDEAPAPSVSLGDCFGFAPNFTFEKLTDVSLLFVCGYPSGMQLVKSLLEASPVLETMELQLVDCSPIDKVSAELLGFRRASPNVKVTVI